MVAEEKPQRGAPSGNRNALFWKRPDIEAAAKALDVWASCRWHEIRGCHGIPRLDWLDGRDERVMRLVRRARDESDRLAGKRGPASGWELFVGDRKDFDRLAKRGEARVIEVSSPSTTGEVVGVRDLPESRLLFLMVEAMLSEFRAPGLIHGLLLHRYPRSGPYARPEGECTYRRFRPPGLIQEICGQLRGRYVERAIDALLQQLEREFLSALSEGEIMREKISGTKNKTLL
jgi:hypothetical protein